MSETNRIEYKQKLNESLEKEVIAFLNYREGGQVGGQVGGQTGGQIAVITDKQREILAYIVSDPKIMRKVLSERLGINESAVQKHLKALVTQKIIARKGKTTGYWIILNHR